MVLGRVPRLLCCANGSSVIVRGINPTWVHSIYGLALQPDAIFYLKVELDDLIPRVLHSGGFDYWESGMDMRLGDDLYESFIRYQTQILEEYNRMIKPYNFQVINATLPVEQIAEQLKERIVSLLPQSGDLY